MAGVIHREAFLRFFVALLAGYRRCLIYPSKEDPNPVRLFNTREFVERLDRDLRAFAAALCKTQVRRRARLPWGGVGGGG